MKKCFPVFLLFIIPLCLIGCGEPSVDEPPQSSGLDYPLDDDGPFNVGYTTFEASYTAPGQTEPRTIPVYIWYPTEDVHNKDAEPPTESPIYIDLFVDSDTIIDAAPAAPVYDSGFPVLAYSHGHRGVAQGSWRLMRYFASHGWVAMSVGHVGNLITEGSEAENTPIEHWHQRPLDISVGLDTLENLVTPEALAGQIDTARVVLTGHSRGAYTTWASGGSQYDIDTIQARCDGGSYPNGCTTEAVTRFSDGFRDNRIVALIPTAGSGHGEFFDGIEGRNTITTPVFMMTASDDPVGAEPVFQNTSIPNFTWVEINGGCHELFNLGCGRTEDSAKFPIVTTYALAFSRHHALGDSSERTLGILDNTVPVSEHVLMFQKK